MVLLSVYPMMENGLLTYGVNGDEWGYVIC